MSKFFVLVSLLFVISNIVCTDGKWQPAMKDNDSLVKLLNEMSQEYNQPAMAAALVLGDNIAMQAAVGKNVYGEQDQVKADSRFHIGSITKSFTAVLVAMLVKEGKLDYNTTLGQILPDMPMRDEYKKVTIANLLDNKAGIIAMQLTAHEDPEIVNKLFMQIPTEYPDPTDQRREVVKLALSLEPIAEPGTKVVYSNVGWPIVGYVLEKITGESYEALLQKRIFDLLGMKTAKVGGWPASVSEPEQPRGHFYAPDQSGVPTPQKLDAQYVLPDWMNPSGGIHCSINDFAIYAREHLQGLQDKGKLLEKEDYLTLHSVQVTTNLKEMYPHIEQDREASFGYGWGIVEKDKGFLSAAAGSGGTFIAQVYIYPAFDLAFVGFTNCGNGGKALTELYKKITGLD